MREELERLLGPSAVTERAPNDLWPRALISARAGGAGPPAWGGAGPPAWVVRPRTVDEIGLLLRWAGARGGVTVTPLGGGSGVCGAISGTAGEILLDTGALDQLEIDEGNLVVRAGAGLNGAVLEEALNARGLTLGHFPSSLPVATLGGLASTRSSGQQSTLHGNIEDLVLGLRVVLPDGTVASSRPPVRSAVGPALHELFLGAEGGLGVIVEVTLAVRPLPAAVQGRGLTFATLGAGLDTLREISQRDLRPLVARLYDPEDTAFQGGGPEGCLLVLALAGEPELVAAQGAVLERLLRRAAGSVRDLGEEPWQRWLDHRFRLSAGRLRQSLEAPGSFLDTIEVAAPWSALEALHADVKAELGAEGVALCHFSHATPQGCCAYFTFAGSAPDEDGALAAYDRAWAAAMAACARHGATIGHHHGAGTARAPWIEAELGEWLTVWKRVRSALDPAGVMNPRAVGGRR